MDFPANNASHILDLRMVVRDVTKIHAQKVSFSLMELAKDMDNITPTLK